MTDQSDPKGKREISTIQFPYLDLEDAISLARVMLDRGAVPMDRDQLAAALGQTPTSGAFNIKLSAARLFALIDSNQGRYQLTDLGFEILDEGREAAAKATAFLNVPLFRKTYDEFKGRQLPPRPSGLEQAFVNFGVAPKQKDRARQVFDRSARTAGFFHSAAEDRLVQPLTIGQPVAIWEGARATDTVDAEVVTRPLMPPITPPMPVPAIHSFIQGLLDTLPETKTDWPTADRAKWLQAAAQIFDLLYSGGEGDIAVIVRKGGQ